MCSTMYMLFALMAAAVTITVAVAGNNTYPCPFRMFDLGRPAMYDNGGVMFCDVTDGNGTAVRCPRWYFCSAGYPDGRAVCCHILGV